MRYISYTLSVILLSLAVGCCWCGLRGQSQPERPAKQVGWIRSVEFGVKFWGPFVLNKGESTDNGKFGVKVLDIIPAACASPLAERPDGPYAILQFYKPVTNEVICKAKFTTGNTVLSSGIACNQEIDFSVIGVTAINSKDNWVAFDLRE